MSPDDLDRALHETLDRRRREHQLRQRIEAHPIDSTHLLIDGKRYVNFASNNYLGLTHHPRVLRAVEDALKLGAGSAAAGLISGYTDVHRSAEQTIARWKGTQACVLLPSGYQANVAAVQTLAALGEPASAGGSCVRFLLDKLVHASLVDAVRASGAEMRVFPHNHLAKLRRLLEEAEPSQMQVVVTESIFSMDGDAADLRGLSAIKKELPFVLLLDDAHGSGVYGVDGAGYAAECGLQEIVDVSIVTLSKALGCVGGAVCGSQAFCDALLNLGRAYIYSTSIPPMIAAAAQAAVEVCREETQRQARVRELAKRVRLEIPALCHAERYSAKHLGSRGAPSSSRDPSRSTAQDDGTRCCDNASPSDSPIIPVVLGDEERAVRAAAHLRDEGLLVVAVRPPTVPRGSSRLRITLSCDHTDAEVRMLVDALKKQK